MKKGFLFFIIAICSVFHVDAAPMKELQHLDSMLVRKPGLIRQKETAISRLRYRFFSSRNNHYRLAICRKLVNQYIYFQYDSAKAYAGRGLLIAQQINRTEDVNFFKIYKARILSTGGIYDAALKLMNEVNENTLTFTNQKEYCITMIHA